MILRMVLPLIVLAFAGIPGAGAQGGVSDPVFSSVPFTQWLAEGEQTRFRWSTRVTSPELSSHQRLQTKVEIQVDGNELVSRRGHGQLVMMIQIQDSADRVYQVHGTIDLQDVKDSAGKSNIVYAQEAFVLPGDYRIGMVIFDAKTGEHSAAQKTLHVNPLRNDPLPAPWKDLPAVELLHAMDSPDDWFRPDITGRLQLPLTTKRPIRVELLMNASPSGPSQGLSAGTANNRSLANLVPALKVFSQVELRDGEIHMTLLDIPRRRVIFEQEAGRPLDWLVMRKALTEADPNKIDVRSLEHREQNAQFFVEQVRQRMGTGGPEQPAGEPFRALIVLSGPTSFNSGEDMRPIEVAGKLNAKVYYIRYHLPAERLTVPPLFEAPAARGRRSVPAPVQPAAAAEPFDSLASLLKPLQLRLFDVYSPEQFRKTLSNLLDEIGRL